MTLSYPDFIPPSHSTNKQSQGVNSPELSLSHRTQIVSLCFSLRSSRGTEKTGHLDFQALPRLATHA